MAHTIEEAKSGRASCRTCKKPIAKGELRLGEEVPNQFSTEPAFQWHHLPCAAKKKPAALKQALASTTLTIPDRAALELEVDASAKKEKPSTFPYAERAATGRSSCIACSTAIDKGTLRVAVERDVDTGSFVTKGAGYLHAACAAGHLALAPDVVLEQVKGNSPGLDATELDALKADLAS